MYNLTDVMEMLDVSERTIRRHLKLGVLKGAKESGVWNFSDNDLEEYFEHYVVEGIIKLKILKNFDEFVKGVSKNSELSFYSKNIYDLSIGKAKELSLRISKVESPMDFKMERSKDHLNISFYGSESAVVEVIKTIGEVY